MLRRDGVWMGSGSRFFYGHGYSVWNDSGDGYGDGSCEGCGDGDNWGDGYGSGFGDVYGGTIPAFPENKEGCPC